MEIAFYIFSIPIFILVWIALAGLTFRVMSWIDKSNEATLGFNCLFFFWPILLLACVIYLIFDVTIIFCSKVWKLSSGEKIR